MKIRVEKRLSRWLLVVGAAALMSILEIALVDVAYQEMHVGMVLACVVLAISLLVKVELRSLWTLPLELVFAAFCGVFLLHIAINGQPLVLGAFVYNMCFSMMFMLLLLAITGRPKLATVIWLTFCWAFGLLDEIVYQFRGNQIVINDIFAIRTAISVAGNYQIEFNTKIMISIITYAAAMIELARSPFGEWKVLRKVWVRLTCVVLAALSAALPVSHLGRYRTFTWVKQGTQGPGILMEFALEISDLYIDKPDGYSEEALKGVAEAYAEEADGELEGASVAGVASAMSFAAAEADGKADEQKLPHVIAIMIESWSDLSVLGDLETSQEVMPFLSDFMETTLHGWAASSVYGGSTATSEWEFLTGNTMAFMPAGSMVYRQFVKDDIRSIVDVMQDNGYTCVAMHPYYATGWDRSRIYPLLGFDEAWFLEDMDWGEVVREYTSDAAFVDKIIERFESRDSDSPLFLFGITMQNHGGYNVADFESTVQVTNLGQEFQDVNQYLSLIRLTDSAMQTLIEYFEECDEDVILLAFGDHQPRLQSAFFSALDNPTDVQKHIIPYFIWKNYEDDQARERPLSSINYLSTLLMDEAGIDLPPYYQFIKQAQETIPSITGMGLIEDGKVVNLEDATAEQQAVLEQYEMLQYGQVFDWDIDESIYTGAPSQAE